MVDAITRVRPSRTRFRRRFFYRLEKIIQPQPPQKITPLKKSPVQSRFPTGPLAQRVTVSLEKQGVVY